MCLASALPSSFPSPPIQKVATSSPWYANTTLLSARHSSLKPRSRVRVDDHPPCTSSRFRLQIQPPPTPTPSSDALTCLPTFCCVGVHITILEHCAAEGRLSFSHHWTPRGHHRTLPPITWWEKATSASPSGEKASAATASGRSEGETSRTRTLEALQTSQHSVATLFYLPPPSPSLPSPSEVEDVYCQLPPCDCQPGWRLSVHSRCG